MDGIFIRKKTNIWLVLFMLCGILLIVLYIYLNTVETNSSGGQLTILIMGILCGLLAVPPMLLNRGAFIRVEETGIKAKYHWFGKLDCRMDDVEFVLPQINTVTILLKNGKRHTIMGLENSWAVASAIRRQGFAVEKEAPDALRDKLAQAQAVRKKELLWVLGVGALLFVNIFITVWLTGGRDLDQFSQSDWIVFSVMGLLELLILVYLFCAAERCGKRLLPIEQLKYRLRGAILATEPLPTNHTAAVYTDENNTGRIAVCGFPNDESVYYCVQEIFGNYELETVKTSRVYENAEQLPEDLFAELIEITPVS